MIAKGGPNGYYPAALRFAANGYGAHFPGQYGLIAAAQAEVILTLLLVLTLIGATDLRAPVGFAGIPISFVLVLIHLVGIPVANTFVNPVRSIGPALFVGGWALQQLWLFLVAPLAGCVLAAAVYRSFATPRPTARDAERALPTEQEERLRHRAAAP